MSARWYVAPFGFLLCGCLVAPLPRASRGQGQREVLNDADLEFLRVGETTREEVLLRLGQPDRAWDEDASLLYFAEVRDFFWMLGEVGAVVGHDESLVLSFDSGGRLRSAERRSE